MAEGSIVSIVACENYEQGRVGPAVAEAIELAGLHGVFRDGKSVLVKPNLLSTRRPEDAVTTHPAVVRAVGEIALDRRCKAAIGDSPPFAGENPTRWQRLVRTTGMSQVAVDLSIELKRFEDAKTQIASPDGRIYRSFEIGTPVAEADVVVSVSKLKTHGLTLLTGAVKNVFGCIPGIQKGLFHVKAAEDREVFAQMLVDVCRAVSPAVHVMDAIVALEGEGPNHGDPRQMGVVLASSDPVALDAVSAALIGVEPFLVHTTRLGHEQGLGCGDLDRIEIRGVALEEARVEGFRLSSGTNEWTKIPYPVRKFLRRQVVPTPRIDPEECTGCGDCASACPVAAITSGRPANVDYEKCIRCYCCSEVCNFGAVQLKLGWLGKLASKLPPKR